MKRIKSKAADDRRVVVARLAGVDFRAEHQSVCIPHVHRTLVTRNDPLAFSGEAFHAAEEIGPVNLGIANEHRVIEGTVKERGIERDVGCDLFSFGGFIRVTEGEVREGEAVKVRVRIGVENTGTKAGIARKVEAAFG